jgi:hypothetical protein
MRVNAGWEQPVLGFIAAHRLGTPGRYRYAAGCTTLTLYSSTYAAMARHLLGDAFADAERTVWVA